MMEKQVSQLSLEEMRADLEATKSELRGYEARLEVRRRWMARLKGHVLSLEYSVAGCKLLIENIEERIAEVG